MKYFALTLSLILVSCTSPKDSGVKVIVGARLADIEHSVVVISDGKIQAAGAQSAVPVPKGSEITSGLGMTLEPSTNPIEPGQPANLILKGGTSRTMRNGEWIQ